ncbi:MAG: carboxypeptidase-like regulatory domain-containing protein [Gemmatimonadaceae bacterium]|nr:carboxypeptidase-like regulatory domain-containing protein [Gemmatimonadaceae bacterium]
MPSRACAGLAVALLAAATARTTRAQEPPCARAAAPREATGRALATVCGIVRDDRDRPVANVEVVASLDDRATRTDSAGSFRLTVPTSARGTLLAVRLLGYAPLYRTIASARDTLVRWDPVLASVQQLAARTVRASGAPKGLASARFDDLFTRFGKGRGHFLIGDDLWRTASLVDALGRVPGVEVFGGAGMAIRRIGMARCNKGIESTFASASRVGVFIDGTDQTNRFTLGGGAGVQLEDQRAMSREASSEREARMRQPYVSAEEVLSELRVGELAAMEVYRGRSEIPGVFANPDYCAVVAVWTR